MDKIGIVGTGRLGLCFAILLEKAGYQVFASDINSHYIDKLKSKKFSSNEPDVNKILRSSKNIEFTNSNFEVIKKTDLIFCFTATPSKKNGSYDLKYLNQVVDDLKLYQNQNKKSKKSLVIGCTTNPGDCDKILKVLEKYNVDIFYNPEFIAQGSVIKDLQQPDMVLIGRNKTKTQVEKKILDIYRKIQINKLRVNLLSLKAAEITKISINCFLTTKISFANMIGQLAIKSNLNNEVDEILKSIGDDTRIGKKFFKFGYGYGGPCLPRDNKALVNYFNKVGMKNKFYDSIDNINNNHVVFLSNLFIKNNFDNLPFYFPYISYKKGTEILTESHSLKVFINLAKKNKKIYVNSSKETAKYLKSNFGFLNNKNIRFIDSKSLLPKKIFKIDI